MPSNFMHTYTQKIMTTYDTVSKELSISFLSFLNTLNTALPHLSEQGDTLLKIIQALVYAKKEELRYRKYIDSNIIDSMYMLYANPQTIMLFVLLLVSTSVTLEFPEKLTEEELDKFKSVLKSASISSRTKDKNTRITISAKETIDTYSICLLSFSDLLHTLNKNFSFIPNNFKHVH